ncbi:MAG: 16S rRNA (guanine(966)-N(2))-methyltransferase RsmD [Elusimicrobiota bacterium]
MSLRISAGVYKKRKLKSPPQKALRPISGMIKEALFSILGSKVQGCFFLDLFAGTGSAGLEALSRGAGKVWFVEKNHEHARIIKENISLLGAEDRCRVVCLDFFKFDLKEKAGIVFAGPPYRDNLSSDILARCVEKDILRRGNLLVIQHHCREKIRDVRGALLKDSRKYGISRLDFFKREY